MFMLPWLTMSALQIQSHGCYCGVPPVIPKRMRGISGNTNHLPVISSLCGFPKSHQFLRKFSCIQISQKRYLVFRVSSMFICWREVFHHSRAAFMGPASLAIWQNHSNSLGSSQSSESDVFSICGIRHPSVFVAGTTY